MVLPFFPGPNCYPGKTPTLFLKWVQTWAGWVLLPRGCQQTSQPCPKTWSRTHGILGLGQGLQCVILGGGSSRSLWSHILWAFVGSFSKLGHRWLLLPHSLQTLDLPGHAAKEREREWGRGCSGQGCTPFVFLLLFRLFVFFLIFYLLSFSLSLSLPPVFLPSSVYLSFPSLPSTSRPPLFLSMVAALMKCYFLASLQNCLKHFKTRFPTSLLWFFRAGAHSWPLFFLSKSHNPLLRSLLFVFPAGGGRSR